MNNNSMPFRGWRLTFFQAIVVAFFLLFTIRLYELQVVRQDFYQELADDNRLSILPSAAPRGAIFDRNGRRLAFNVPAYNVTIIPAALPRSSEEELAIFNRISALVGVPPTREIALLSGQPQRSIEELVAEGEGIAPFRPVIVAQDIPLQAALQILEARVYMPGVNVEAAAVREYPTGALTSHIIGYMGPISAEEELALRELGYNPAFDRIGYEGIERFLENVLTGQRGSVLREVDVAGEVVAVLEEIQPVPGQNVRLTIDVELQAAAEQALIDQITLVNTTEGRIRTQSGVVIAINPQTGEVLALVSWPTYDNSRFARAIDGPYYLELIDDPQRPLFNNAIKGLYPPGSVWKMITAAGVLEENVIAPETYLIDEGVLLLENRYAPNDPAASQRFVCWLRFGHGLVNFIESIAWSCDVYFYQVGGGNPAVSATRLRPGGLGIDDLFRYATATGIGAQQGIELPFEVAGRMPDPDWKRRNYGESWSTGDTYNAAFGQGYVTVTPLQLITSTAALVNGGILYQPTLIRDFLDAEGNVITPFQPHVLRTVNLDAVGPDETITLLLLEDMLMKGPASLACTCESTSPYYDPLRCDPEGYRNTVNISSTDFIEEQVREYRVHIPFNYVFNRQVCQPVRFSTPGRPYSPAFISTETLQLVDAGARAAVTIPGGTALNANLPYTIVAGKTGTAEYCDDIARPLGLCVPGQWPAHAWFVGYAPYGDPEIMVQAFVYNGGEGSQVALPIVIRTMEAYFRLKSEREGGTLALPSAPSP